MKYYRNKYSVYKDGVCWLNDIDTYDGALEVVEIITRGASNSEVQRQFLQNGGSDINGLEFELFRRRFWRKANVFDISIRAIRTNEIVELDERLDKVDNALLSSSRAFNGKGLKLKSIEPQSKFKLGDFHDPDTWFALSVWRNKGWSTLGKAKKQRSNGGNVQEAFAKLESMPDYGEYTKYHSIVDTIQTMRSTGMERGEICRILKGKLPVRQLKKLIASI